MMYRPLTVSFAPCLSPHRSLRERMLDSMQHGMHFVQTLIFGSLKVISVRLRVAFGLAGLGCFSCGVALLLSPRAVGFPLDFFRTARWQALL